MKIALIVLAVIAIVVIIWFRQQPTDSQSSSSPIPSGNAEEELRKLVELGVIDHMPEDSEAYMEKVRNADRLCKEWAEIMQNKQGMIGVDGFPLFDKVYPLAIEHYVNDGGYSFSNSDRQNVAKAALHFDKYWRSVGEFPKEESGYPKWLTIYGQIQDHYRQWTNGMIP